MKAVIANLEEVPEAIRGEYESKNGKFVLKVEGELPGYAPLVEANTRLAEFRDNNRTLNSKVTELEGKLKPFENIDPAKYTEMSERIVELEKRGVKGAVDIEAQLKAAVAAAVGPLEQKIAAREASERAAVERADRESLRSALQAAGTKAGIDDKAMEDYVERGLKVFKSINGEIVARKGDNPVFSKEHPAELLSVEEWASTLQTEAPHLFRPSRGGGAGGNGSGGGPVVKKSISMDPLEFGRNLEGLAKGEVTVNLQG